MNDSLINEIIWDITDNSLAKLGFNKASIFLLDDNNSLVQKTLNTLSTSTKNFTPLIFKLGNGIIGRAAENKISIKENSFDENNNPISEIAIPIIYSQKLLGIIYCVHNKNNYFQDSHIEILKTISSVCAIKIDKIQSQILEKKLSQELLEQLNLNRDGQINELFQVAIDAVFVVDENEIIINWNNTAEKIFGWNSSEIIGQKLSEKIIHNEFNQDFNELFTKVKSNEISDSSSNYLIDIKAVNKDNNKFDFSIGISSSDFQSKKIYIVYFRDITERKKAEESLLKSKEKAEVENKSKSDFLANMSHEIRTPMNAIIGFSDLLFQSISDEKQKSQVDAIRTAAKNLLGIINDILDLSKIESGKMELSPERVNIINLINDIEIIFKNSISEKGLEYFTKIDTSGTNLLMIDGLRLRQILINLISNAIKFTANGYIKLHIEIIKKVENPGKANLFCMVEDTGIGIHEDQQAVIFGEYIQQKGQDFKQYGGTGLGLTISRNLIELMGGKINITSTVGKGSIFSFYIPDIEVISNDSIIENISKDKSLNVIFEKAKVLIVDDIASNRELIKDILYSSDLEYYEADNGKTAIELTNEHLPDLILMDLKMQVMNGLEATKIIKNQAETKNIPVIAVTASAMELIENQNELNIFDELITKPIDVNKFKNTLKKYLKVKHNEDEAENTLSIKNDIIKFNKNKLEEVVIILENKFIPMISKAVENQIINEFENIGIELVNLGNDYSNNIIIEYGNKINTLTYNFEIRKLTSTLKVFPDFIENIKQHYN